MRKTSRKPKNKKVVLLAASALALTATIAATFAWFTGKDSVKNSLYSRPGFDGMVKIVENFDPPGDPEDPENPGWVPGANVTKEVGAVNTGDLSAFVRMSFDEILSLPWGTGAPAADVNGYNYTHPGNIPAIMNDSAAKPAGFKKLEVADVGEFTNVAAVLAGLPSGVTVNWLKDGSEYKFVAYYTISGIGASEETAIYNGSKQKVEFTANVAGGNLTIDVTGYLKWTLRSPDDSYDWTVEKPSPLTNPWISQAGTLDSFGLMNDYVNLIFSANVTLSGAPQAGKWFYNVNDGYFYYIGVLDSGATTPYLLEKLYLDNAAKDDPLYKCMNYDLIVNMDAVQNETQFIAEWNLNAVSDAALIAALSALCS